MVDFAEDTSTELERKIKVLAFISLVETVSYALLFAFWVSGNTVGTKLAGGLHGWVFIVFAVMVVSVRAEMEWSWAFAAVAVLTGPLGALLVFERIRREGVPAHKRRASLYR